MLNVKKTHRQGFLDGMRHSGKLAIDVPDEDVELSHDWRITIEKCYQDRNYDANSEGVANLHRIFQPMVIENEELKTEVGRLTTLLEECNRIRAYEASQ